MIDQKCRLCPRECKAQCLYQCIRLNIHTQIRQHLSSSAVCFFHIHSAKLCLYFSSQKNILCNCQIRHQHNLLMNDSDSLFLRIGNTIYLHILTIDSDFSTVRLINSSKDLDKRRFSRSILS